MNLMSSFRFIRFLGKIYAVWPLEDDAGKLRLILYEALWRFYMFNYFIVTSFTIFTCYLARHDITIASFSWMEFVAETEAVIVLMNSKYYRSELRYVLLQTESYLIRPDEREKSFLNKKSRIFGLMMMIIVSLYATLVLLYCINPAVTPWDSLFTTVYYPESIRSPLTDILLYVHQFIIMFHTSVMVNLDVTVVLLVYVCSVRLKILSADLAGAYDYVELKEYIREHQYILRLAKKINYVVRIVVSKTVVCFISYSVGAGLQITNPNASTASYQRFGVVLLINTLRLLMIAISADELTSVSVDVGQAVYATDWPVGSKDETTAKLMILMRCQKPVGISLPGIMPTLKLAYVSAIIASSMSYFTTLRAVANWSSS